MSKAIARKPESYKAEPRLFAAAKRAVEDAGFDSVKAFKSGPVKLVDAVAADGSKLRFWVKLGWSNARFAAIQFGLFSGEVGSQIPDRQFVDHVKTRVEHMKERGATHVLLTHGEVFAIALKVDDLLKAYKDQINLFPTKARNTKSPTLWFYDPRPHADPAVTKLVLKYAIPLDVLSKSGNTTPEDPAARSRIAEVEARIQQGTFRFRVGQRYGWRCAVTGCKLKDVLDAAHLPGRDWRKHNAATDGVLLRADLHRLLDCGLAEIREGKLAIHPAAKKEYGGYDGRSVHPSKGK